MKHKVLLTLLSILLGGAISVKAQTEPPRKGGVYQISTIENLIWFATQVNGGQTALNAELTADIAQGDSVYTPVGSYANPYKGTFDGQGHSITLNLGNNEAYTHQGIFGSLTDGATIRRLVAKGVVKALNYVAGIAGSAQGDNAVVTFEECGNEATITGTRASEANAAGILGCNEGGKCKVIMTRCYNAGTITGHNSGALCGWACNDGDTRSQFTQCYNAGKVNNGSGDFARNGSSSLKLDHCYYLTGCNSNYQKGNGQLEELTSAQTICDRLNSFNGTYWGMMGGTHPVLGSDNLTDLTDVYLSNPDFITDTPIKVNIRGYGKDMAEGEVYGFQNVTGWTNYVVAGDNSNATFPNSAMAAGVMQYGLTSSKLCGAEKAPPAQNPDGKANGNCLGFMAVWSCGGYYYQTVTLPKGTYTLRTHFYKASGDRTPTTDYIAWLSTNGTVIAQNASDIGALSPANWYTLQVTFTLTATTTGRLCIGYVSGGGGKDNAPHLFFDHVQLLGTGSEVGWEQVTDVDQLGQNDFFYMLKDAKSENYTVSHAAPYTGNRPVYMSPENPYIVPSQLWTMEKDGSNYSLRGNADGYYFNAQRESGKPWTSWIEKANSSGNYTITKDDNKFLLRSETIGGTNNYVGPYNDDGYVNLAGDPTNDAGHVGVAANKPADKAPGFYIYRMKRTVYAKRRIYSQTLMANGWSQVVEKDGLGKTGYEYLLLDMSEQGVESGYVLTGNVKGVGYDNEYKGKYTVLSSGSDPDDIQKWRMAATGTGFYLKNVSNDLYFYAKDNSWKTGFTADDSAEHIDFAFTVENGLWTLVNSFNTGAFVGRWSDNEYHPYDGEDVAFNKAANKGKRLFMILSRPTGNLGIVNEGEEGWKELQALPADVNNYFYSYYSGTKDGLGIKLDGTVMRYTADLNPNTDKYALWTLAKDPDGHILNTAAMHSEAMMQVEWNEAWNYNASNNGGATINNYAAYDWGYIVPTYSAAAYGWHIQNGKYGYTDPSDIDNKDKLAAPDADGAYKFYLGAWTPANDYATQRVASNKVEADRDTYEIFAIPRGRYVANDVAGKSAEQDISYMITNADATRRTLIGWTTEGGDFQVQDNDAFERKDGTYYFEAYDSRTLTDRQMYQEYTDVPDGYYTITALTNVAADGAYLFLNGEQVPLKDKNGDGLVSLTARIANGTLRFGVKLKDCETNWVTFDKVRLYYNTQADKSDQFLWNPSFELSNEADGHMMGWTTPNKSTMDNQTETRSNDDLSGKHGTWYFNTYDENGASTKLDLQTTTKVQLPAGVYQLSAQLCTYNGHTVTMEAYEGENTSGTLLNSVSYTGNHEGAINGGSQVSEKRSLFFTLNGAKYVTIYVYTEDSSVPFFKADDFRLVSYTGANDIASEVLPNPSFEYADASHTPAVPAIVYSTQKGINKLGTDVADSGIYGWDISDMNITGGAENRVGLGSNNAYDQYYYIGDDKVGIPKAADGTRYFFSGHYRRKTGGEQTKTMTTQTLGDLPVGTYIATIKYKAAVSCQTMYDGVSWSTYESTISLYEGTWPIIEGEDMTLTLSAKNADGSKTFATATASNNKENIKFFDRAAGSLNQKSKEKYNVGGRPQRNTELSGGGWTKIWLVFSLNEPQPVTFEVAEQLRSAYGIDLILDDLKLELCNEIPKPANCETSLEAGEEYYILNAATGYWLGAGANLGTHASLIRHGQPFKWDGSKLDSYVYNNENDHYLGSNNYLDNVGATVTLTNTGGDKFTIGFGDGKYVTPVSSVATTNVIAEGPTSDELLNKWYFISKAKREETMLNDPQEPDATFYIPNASFGRNQNTQYNKNLWKSNHYQGNWTLGDPHVAEAYHTPFYVKKTVTVPNGTYKFRAQGFYREDPVGYDGLTAEQVRNDYLPVFFANDEEVTFPKLSGESSKTQAEISFNEGKYFSDYVTVVVKDNLLTVGCRLDVNESLWSIWDNFELELVSKGTVAETENLDAVNAAFTEMEAAPGFEGGQWSPYTVAEAKDMLVAKGSAGSYTFEAIDTKFPNSFDKVDEYLLGLKNTEFVNAFYRGDFAEYHNWDVKNNSNYRTSALGWTTTGTDVTEMGVVGLRAAEPAYDDTGNVGLRAIDSRKALYIASGTTATYGSATGYTMPLKNGKTYKLSFRYGGWGDAASTINLSGTGLEAVTLTGTASAHSTEGSWQTYTKTFTATGGNTTIQFAVSDANAAIADLQLYPSTEELDPNRYYLYNVGAGKYLDLGKTKGREAVLTTVGLDFGVAENGVGYSFDSQIIASQNNHYLANELDGDDLYCDVAEAAWYVGKVGDKYTLYNASDQYLTYDATKGVTLSAYTGAANQQWQLKTYGDRVKELTDMTAGAEAVDATFLIRDNDFTRNDARLSEWSIWANYYGSTLHEFPEGSGHNEVQFRRGGLNRNYVIESYNRAFDISQTLTTRSKNGGAKDEENDANNAPLPYGVYTLTAQQFWNNPNGLGKENLPYLYVKDNNAENAKIVDIRQTFDQYEGDLGFENGTISANFVDDEANHRSSEIKAYIFGDPSDGNNVSFTVGAKCDGIGSWAVLDNFRLTYRPFAYTDATEEAERRKLVNIGDAPFEIPTTDTYYTAMQAANDKVTDASASGHITSEATEGEIRPVVRDILSKWIDYVDKAQVNAYREATATKFNIKNGQYTEVLTVKGKKINAAANTFATRDSIKLNFDEAAGSIFPQALTFTPVSGEGNVNCFTLSYTDGNGDTRYFTSGIKANSTAGNKDLQIRATDTEADALAFRVTPQSTKTGIWYLKNTSCSATDATSGYDDYYMRKAVSAHGRRFGLNDTGFYTGEGTAGVNAYNFSFPEAQTTSATVSVSGTYHYSTLMLPFDAELPEGVTAYTVQGTLSDKTIALESVGRNIKANVPYVLQSENGCSGKILQGFGQAFTDDTQSDAQLTGTFFADRVYVPKDDYVLSVKVYCEEEVTAFYRVTEANSVRLPQYRAYYTHKDINLDRSSAPASAKASFYPFTILNQGITPADIITLVNMILKKDQENAPKYIQRADGRVMYTDVNGDGEVTLADVTALVNLMNKNR